MFNMRCDVSASAGRWSMVDTRQIGAKGGFPLRQDSAHTVGNRRLVGKFGSAVDER